MVDRVIWELSIMIRRADFALFSQGELIAGLSVYPDVLPGDWEPRDWPSRFAPLEVGVEHRHEITPDQLRRILPATSEISWGQFAVVDLFGSRIWLHGRGDGLVVSYSKANPSDPKTPEADALRRIERDLFALRDAMHNP
ncbi:hypothetical protein [Microvirga sp. VF16]|uniref:hypothetical protein n=1 Tax=Microvirga sp. VF16 TaxID=2807101 RepID=UPI00193E5C4C|nr:hypothetical protein [Microvirga sp. VF16]QRM34690.1 hypothetical protein JO965_41160 [Microvirga sp. VF16]